MASVDDIPFQEHIIAARSELILVVLAMLGGTLPYLEGTDRILTLAGRAGIYDDRGIIPFIAILSETDALPRQRVRPLWLPSALEKLQPELDAAERWAREIGEPACRDLLKRLQNSEAARLAWRGSGDNNGPSVVRRGATL